MGEITLRRYTNLPAAIHILRNRCLTLLNPSLWDDRNDAFFMSQYKERRMAQSVLALCFAETFETYHHWRVFSHGSDGICIEFDKQAVIDAAQRHGGVISKAVTYRQITEISGATIDDEELPFLKRFPYQDESEFRLLYVNINITKEIEAVAISLTAVTRITLSPWMPIALADAVKATLKQIKGCKQIKIYRSTLIENERWKKAASGARSVIS